MSASAQVAKGPPRALGKELASIVLLRPRSLHARLDVGPFYALYGTLAAASAVYWFQGQETWARYTYYSIAGVALLHVLVLLFTQWSVRVKAAVGYYVSHSVERASHILAVPPKLAGAKELVRVHRKQVVNGPETYDGITFEFRKHKFVYNATDNVFEKLKFPVKETFEHYNSVTGYGTEAKVKVAAEKWGANEFEVPLPPFISLLKEQMLAPFFVFQVFCVGLWCIDDYWYYSLFTLFMLITFECTVVNQRLRNLTELRNLQTPKQALQVYRCGRWDSLPGNALLPGDIISIGRPPAGPNSDEMVVPADCLILAGSCIVEEAVLTGESTPQWKVPITGASPAARLDIKMDKQYMLFGGTKILQHTPEKGRIKTPDGGCLAVVLRTGFETSQGQLMRTILYSTERITANNLETGIFILFLLIFAISAAYYVLVNGLEDEKRSKFKLTLNCIMIITSVIPPELPMELSIAVNASLVALARKSVFCTEPFRIPFGGKVEVCCFDKTGTLTTDHLLLEGIAACGAVAGESDDELHRDFTALPPHTQRVLASCHALALVGEEVIGDPLEKAAVEAVDWSYSADVSVSPDKKTRCTILHRHHFSSALKRMSAVVRVEADAGISHAAVLKGAPEVVKQFLAEVPAMYDGVYRRYASQGGRVIALAYRDLPPELDAAALRALSREALEEQGGLTFCGFAVFQCPLKEESEPALAQLADSSHQLMMITGDAPLTACYAASKVHIVTRDVLLLGLKSDGDEAGGGPPPHKKAAQHEDADFQWVSPDLQTVLPYSRTWWDVLELASKYDLCISGDSLAHLEATGAAARIIPLAQVYARVSPEQKELVLKTLRAAGHVTLMCGDGTNDVGGLKAAHVGVALLTLHKPEGRRAKARAKELAEKKKKAPKRKTKGQQQLDEWRKAGRPVTPQMEQMAAWLDKMDAATNDAEAPMLKPGDASMAAPFTAKATGVTPCCAIIKQGRCTLVTTVQMFKILGLLCLSTAYSLSVMYLQGVKLSDIQATLMGFLTAGLFFFISNAKPLERLSTTRPHPTIFNPYFFLSLCGQFAMHMGFLIYMYNQALVQMPEGQRQEPDTDFQPNLVNSVCYLVQAVVQLTTFAANYVGHPFNTSITENRGLLTCLHYSALFLVLVASGIIPQLSSGFGLVPLPPALKMQLLLGSALTFLGCFYLEQGLRHGLPPPTPPSKGYLWHPQDLLRLRAQRAQSKKQQ